MSTALAIKADLREEWPKAMAQLAEPSKIVARKIGCTERAVENLKAGIHLASLPVALAFAKEYPPFRELLARYMDAELGESGESPAFVLHEIERLLKQRK